MIGFVQFLSGLAFLAALLLTALFAANGEPKPIYLALALYAAALWLLVAVGVGHLHALAWRSEQTQRARQAAQQRQTQQPADAQTPRY